MLTLSPATAHAGPETPQLATVRPGGEGTICRSALNNPGTSTVDVTSIRGNSNGSLCASTAYGDRRSLMKPRVKDRATALLTRASTRGLAVGSADAVKGNEN